MIRKVSIQGYRSLRAIDIEFDKLTVVLGENGAGKTNIYRALELVRSAATGSLAAELAREGGMPSVLWAGKSRDDATRLNFTVEVGEIDYFLSLGLPGPADPALALDPAVKEEKVHVLVGERRVSMLERKGPHIAAREPDGSWRSYHGALLMAETALSTLRDPRQFPELQVLQSMFTDWRFHHGFRVDPDSPLRQPQVAFCAPTLDSGGGNLAATIATAIHLTEGAGSIENSEIAQAVSLAFDGARLEFPEQNGRFSIGLRMPGFQRAFTAQELSDGMLRYLCLVAALCSYRRPAFMALNEPETSLHAGLIDPLGQMLLKASRDTQLLIVTHSDRLARILEIEGGARVLRLEKTAGETRLVT